MEQKTSQELYQEYIEAKAKEKISSGTDSDLKKLVYLQLMVSIGTGFIILLWFITYLFLK